MQRQYQVCPPGLPDGMALALTEEALRVVQDILPFHQVIPPTNAEYGPFTCLHPPSRSPYPQEFPYLGKMAPGPLRLVGLGAMVYADSLAGSLLDR